MAWYISRRAEVCTMRAPAKTGCADEGESHRDGGPASRHIQTCRPFLPCAPGFSTRSSSIPSLGELIPAVGVSLATSAPWVLPRDCHCHW
ncbi:unnamed protein product [Mycena citricolor]|uniref:Uncharacterized protein n=1 Tax=Mycena citricolor TaxID=2018698 RepID=A0AAD2HA23_9AGAR|nr:unnamed protein product [Mycena citricolor]